MDFYVVANWKMNGSKALCAEFEAGLANIKTDKKIIIAPPFGYLSQFSNLTTAGQNCSQHDSGAYTGEVSATMLAELGAKYVILGHSERRQYFNEDNQLINAKIKQALANGLTPIICVGESLEEYESGKTKTRLKNDLSECLDGIEADIIIAYEPLWAIGTGKTPTLDEISTTHDYIKSLYNYAVLYGGSVKPSNASEISAITNVNGLLVGGASLELESFKSLF